MIFKPKGFKGGTMATHYFNFRSGIFLLLAISLFGCGPSPHEQLIEAVENGDVETINRALERGADLNLGGDRGRTALHLAAETGNEEVVRLLVEAGADVTLPTEYGDTALHFAVRTSGVDLVQFLIDSGAEIHATSGGPYTPLVYASSRGELSVVELLLGYTDSDSSRYVYEAHDWAVDAGRVDTARILFMYPKPVQEDRWVDSPEGLRFRAEPFLDAETVGVLPHQAVVYVVGESLFDQEIGGVKGRWAKAEWQGQTGWLFNAYIKEMIPLVEGVIYKAAQAMGRRNADGGPGFEQELLFLPDRRVWYTTEALYYDGWFSSVHPGTYTLRGHELILELEEGYALDGNEWSGPRFRPAAAYARVLIWRPDLTALIDRDQWREISKDGGYKLDTKLQRFAKEDEDGYDRRGYFVLQDEFHVGDTGPAGGVIFYDKGSFTDGWRYMEVARADVWVSALIQAVTWGSPGTTLDVSSTSIGAGKSNTEWLVDADGSDAPAAILCAKLEMGGHDDWFLPSVDEVKAMYANQRYGVAAEPLREYYETGGPPPPGYWTSSENDGDTAWQVLGTHQYAFSKNDIGYVRPVRRF